MNFKDAEILINLSILHNGPPLLIVGNNGIGKTAMIESVVAKYKRAVFIPDRIDFGGLKQAEGQIKNLKIKTIAISDMQNILTRKSQIRTSTIGVLSSWISEGVGGNELGFNNINLTNKGFQMYIYQAILKLFYAYCTILYNGIPQESY
jgi:hypothetical protein